MAQPPPIRVEEHALFLDFDGTLAEFADDPAAVSIAPAALRRLIELQTALSGALGIVSGRRIADLDRFLDPLAFAAAGVHGLERRVRPDGATNVLTGSELMDPLRVALAEALAATPGIELEDKGLALVLHYRTAPEREARAKAIMREAVAGRRHLAVMEGDGVVEVHPAGMDKGKAVADLMGLPPFAGRIPIYAGDDVTDEFALSYVRKAGGVAIKVGDAPSVADYRLSDVAALHRWLGVRA